MTFKNLLFIYIHSIFVLYSSISIFVLYSSIFIFYSSVLAY